MNLKTQDQNTTPVYALQFLPGSEGRSQLNVTVAVPDYIVQAYQAALQKKQVLVEQHLCSKHVEELIHSDAYQEVQVVFTVGEIYFLIQAWEQAVVWYERALALEDHGMVHHQLGRVYTFLGQWEEAMTHRRLAFKSLPEDAEVCRNYGLDLLTLGRSQEGMGLIQKAATLRSNDPELATQVLFLLNHRPDQDPQATFEAYCAWGQKFAPQDRVHTQFANNRDPNRRLRVAYLSGDFRNHATLANVAMFFTDANRSQFEIYGYGSVGTPDHVTQRIAQQCDGYRDIFRLSDPEVVELMRRDGIDILVTIGGHVPSNRLAVLAYKPAPILVDFGGINTTGMTQVDYRLTDVWRDTPDQERFYLEENVYLAHGGECFIPPSEAPELSPLPAVQRGYVTFACFNNGLKHTDRVLRLWATILMHEPKARLLLKFKAGEVPAVQAAFCERFARCGGDVTRLDIRGWTSTADHFRLYQEADIGLDTYPYAGCVTSCEAMWMGLPLICLAPPDDGTWTRRIGRSFLKRVDLEYFAAETDEAYVQKAVALARNPKALAALRGSMRTRMMAPGGLCDSRAYMATVESAYRWMWQKWIGNMDEK